METAMAKRQPNHARGKKTPCDICTATEAANILGMSRRAISQAARAGKIDGVYGGLMGDRLIGITRDSVNRIIDCRKTRQPTNGYQARDIHPATKGGYR